METNLHITPIEHATMVLMWDGKVIYTDPVGEASLYSSQLEPDIVLVTDIHGDHFSLDMLKNIVKEKTTLIVPRVVADEIRDSLPGRLVIMNNGETIDEQGFKIEAIPMYNFPESPNAFHTKGRGNGYVLERGGKRVYVAGDTAGISEMRDLKDIDIAFIPMNLPYTMPVEEAAETVLDFKPKEVIPYHYRGMNEFSDINKFKSLVNAGDPSIKVTLLDFYPQAKA